MNAKRLELAAVLSESGVAREDMSSDSISCIPPPKPFSWKLCSDGAMLSMEKPLVDMCPLWVRMRSSDRCGDMTWDTPGCPATMPLGLLMERFAEAIALPRACSRASGSCSKTACVTVSRLIMQRSLLGFTYIQ